MIQALTIAMIAAIVALAFAIWHYRSAAKTLNRRIHLIENLFKYSEFVYAEAAKNRNNAKKGQIRSFYTGRMSAAVDILKYAEEIDKTWDRK